MEIARLTPETIHEIAKKAADLIAGGGIVVYPTDTLYGIGVNAFDQGALTRLKRLKVREQKKPMSVLVPSIEHIHRYAEFPEAARMLAERHLPGALTLILPAHPHAPQDVTLHGSLGVRVPDDEFCRALSSVCDHPITATSANRAGLTTPATVKEIITHFGADIEHVDLIIDAGERSGGAPSTVVSFVHGHPPKILREGKLTREELGL